MLAALLRRLVGVAEPGADKRSQTTKEWQSSAALEGFADTISAYAWTLETESNCAYDRHYSSDFDLDGAVDNAGAGSSSAARGSRPQGWRRT